MTDREQERPAWQRPPFEPGNDVGVQFEPENTIAATHGAYSDRLLEPLVVQARAELADRVGPEVMAAWLEHPTFADLVAAHARTIARIRRVSAWLEERGDVDGNGKPRPAAALLTSLERLALDQSRELGITPRSFAGIASDLRPFAPRQGPTPREEIEAARERAARMLARAEAKPPSLPELPKPRVRPRPQVVPEPPDETAQEPPDEPQEPEPAEQPEPPRPARRPSWGSVQSRIGGPKPQGGSRP